MASLLAPDVGWCGGLRPYMPLDRRRLAVGRPHSGVTAGARRWAARAVCYDSRGVAPPWQCVAAMRRSPVDRVGAAGSTRQRKAQKMAADKTSAPALTPRESLGQRYLKRLRKVKAKAKAKADKAKAETNIKRQREAEANDLVKRQLAYKDEEADNADGDGLLRAHSADGADAQDGEVSEDYTPGPTVVGASEVQLPRTEIARLRACHLYTSPSPRDS